MYGIIVAAVATHHALHNIYYKLIESVLCPQVISKIIIGTMDVNTNHGSNNGIRSTCV